MAHRAILRKLDNIQHRDAILAYDSDWRPVEPNWPEAEFIVGKMKTNSLAMCASTPTLFLKDSRLAVSFLDSVYEDAMFF